MLRIKRLCLAASLFLTLFALPAVAETTKEVCFSGAATIPNDAVNGLTNGVTTSVSVIETGIVSKIRLTQVNITHGHIGEISASLIHVPSNTIVHIGADPGDLALSADQGCVGKDIDNLTIADDGTESIETSCVDTRPAYDSSAVHKPMGKFSDFNNVQVNGIWSLKVADHHSFNTAEGSVTKWCLEYTRPTNTVIKPPVPAEGDIDLGAAYYSNGVTQEIVIESESGDDFIIESVKFIDFVPAAASADFIGSINQELPTTASVSFPLATPIILKPGYKYRFSAECVPTGTGDREATFQITTNLPFPNDVLSYPLSCNGNVALYSAEYNSAAISPSSTKNMGSTALATELKDDKLIFKNTGNQPLKLNVASSGSDDITMKSPTSPITIAGGSSQTITFACTPTGAGARSRQFTFTPDATTPTPDISPDVKYTFSCSGDGPVAQFTPAINSGNSFINNFNVGTAVAGFNDASNTIKIKNGYNGTSTTASLTLSNGIITNDTGNAFSLGTAFPLTIAKNSTQDISLTCKGTTLAVGTYTAKFTVDTNDANDPKVVKATFNLKCTVEAPKPVATFLPVPAATLDFNTVGSTGGEKVIGITNGASATKVLEVTSGGFSEAVPHNNAAAFELEFLNASGVAVAGTSISIGMNATGSIKVKCKGDVHGDYSAILTLTINHPDPTKQTITYPVSCIVADNDKYPLYASNPAPSSTIDFGNVQVDSTPGLQTIQVSEVGNADLKVGFDPIDNPDFSIDTPTTFPFTITDTKIGTSATVDITIKCNPSSDGIRTGILKLKATDSSGTVAVTNYPAPTYNLSCNGTRPAYSSTPSPSATTPPTPPITFGTVKVGASVSKSVVITNSGGDNTSLSVDTPTFSGDHPLDFSTSGLPISLTKGASATMTVTCTPTGLEERKATLELKTNDSSNLIVTYLLECTGEKAVKKLYSSVPAVNKDASNKWTGEIDFGNVPINTPVQKTLTIRNNSEVVLNVAEPANAADFLTGDTATFSVVNRATLFTTNPLNGIKPQPGFFIPENGGDKVIDLKCQPTTTGAHTAILTLLNDDNDVSKRTVTYTLKCNGIKAGYSSTPAPASTLTCGGTTTLTGSQYLETVTVAETGGIDLELNSVTLGGANASDFAILTFPTKIANGAPTQEIKVKFSPTVAGTREAVLMVSTNDPDPAESATTYKLSCKAEVPPAPPVIATRTLTVAVTPSEGGTVNDDLGQIRCGKGTTACSGIFDINTAINLTTTAATGYQFKNWTGDCATGSVMLNANKACTANFEAVVITPPDKPTDPTQPTDDPTKPVEPGKPTDPSKPVEPGKPTDPSKPTEPGKPTTPDKPPVVPPTTDTGSANYTVTVATSGKGSGKITGDSINCGDGGTGKCSHTVPAGTQMMFSAQPAAGSTFLGWSGHCEGKTAITVINMTEHKQCVARFELLATEPEKEDDGLGNYCTGRGYTNISCNARGAVIGDIDGKIEVDSAGYLSNGIVTKPLTNKGWVANLTIEDTGSLTGGIVTGSIINKGEMSNFEFRGDVLSGGKLSGVIKNNSPNVCFSDGIVRGVIKDVSLAANTRILGGRLSGKIVGDSQYPARLSKVILTSDTSLSNVLLEEDVIIEQDVSHQATKMIKVKLAPHVKIQGGKISGELTGEEAAPAHLSNLLIKSGTVLENVILDDQVEIEDEKTCENPQLDDTVDQNATATDDAESDAIALNPNGKQAESTTRFKMQLTTSRGKRANKAVLSQQEAKDVNLSAHITVQAEHQGKVAKTLVVVQHKNADKTVSYMKTASGWKIWDGQLEHLQPLENYQQLPASVDFSVFTGDLSNQGGEFSLYAGYRLQDGTLVFNGQNPLNFAVTRIAESCALTCGCQ